MLRTILAALVLATPAAAQQPCAAREHVIARLQTVYGEVRNAYGLTAGGGLMEFWANVETRSWSLTISTPDGRMCLMATGEDFGTMVLSPRKGDPT